MSIEASAAHRRLSAVMREGEQVTPLELFFDLVFVLAITQCTALMAGDPTWGGLARGLLVLAVLWWCWVGYAWLTSVIDPEEGVVRIAIFAAMAGLLVAALCVPHAFNSRGLLFACAYAAVRFGQIALFVVGSRDDPHLRQSVLGLGASTAVSTGILIGASFADGALQGGLWLLAIVLDMGGPFVSGIEGWKLIPRHFAERHGLIVLIALGESVVAIGVGSNGIVNAGVVGATVAGTAIAGALWWLYFDVVAIVATRKLESASVGREQNAIARDSYSYLHFPMVAGIVLIALGMKTTLAHISDPLSDPVRAALLGGTATYLLGHIAFRLRNVHSLNRQRLVVAAICLALIPATSSLPALATLGVLAVVLASLIAYEFVRFGEARERIRHELRAT